LKEKVKELFGKLKQQSSKLSPKMKRTMFIGALLAIIFSVGVAFFLNNKPYATLFSGLDQQEASEIIGKLQDSGVNYKYSDNGTISVPKDQEEKLKAELVYEGYPKSGFTYDVFKNNVNMMSTDFEKNSYKLYDLQNRIGATIRLFDGVSDAKVTIAVNNDNSKYVISSSNNQSAANASVVVIMKDGGSPTAEQVKGIQRLVSKSIPNMQMDDVAVIDGNGNDVSSVGDDTTEGANKAKLDFEKHMDDSVRAKILTVLSPIYGSDNIRISVRTKANVDKTVKETINHEATDKDNNKGIPSTESTETEMTRDGTKTGGVPGTQTNTGITTYGQLNTDGTESYVKNQTNTNYLVNQQKEQSQTDAGSIDDMTVSVAINSNDTGSVNDQQLKSLIGNAAGIPSNLQNEKIAIVSTPFYSNGSTTPANDNSAGKNNWIIIGSIASGVLLIALVLFILLVMRKRKKKKAASLANVSLEALGSKHSKASEEAYLKELMQKQQEDKENKILNLNNEKGLELKNKVREIAEENPEISAQLIRNWLKGGE
jgi:flagellar M-ring protein FliF